MEIPKEWIVKSVTHHQEKRIAIYFQKDVAWQALIRQFVGSRWSSTMRAWHIPDNAHHRKLLGLPVVDTTLTAIKSQGNLADQVRLQIERCVLWMRSKRYSSSTIESYSKALLVFFNFYKNKNLHDVTNDDVITFNTQYILERKLSATYQSQFINALKLFYQLVNDKKIDLEKLVRPQKPFQLPKVISEQEVAALINATTNIKHKSMLSLIYSAGLRRSELLNLKPSDIDSIRMMIYIRKGKGMKDRHVPLSAILLAMLREYYKKYKPINYLFEGQHGGQYTGRSLELVIKRATILAGIKKNINLHMLRHSYATHLLEGGTNLRHIQELLGHRSPTTTQIYTHVSKEQIGKISSPLDKLNLT